MKPFLFVLFQGYLSTKAESGVSGFPGARVGVLKIRTPFICQMQSKSNKNPILLTITFITIYL